MDSSPGIAHIHCRSNKTRMHSWSKHALVWSNKTSEQCLYSPYSRELKVRSPHLGVPPKSGKSIVFVGFPCFQGRESLKNVEKRDFSAAPAAGCGKKRIYRCFQSFSINLRNFRPPYFGPNGGGQSPPPFSEEKTLSTSMLYLAHEQWHSRCKE